MRARLNLLLAGALLAVSMTAHTAETNRMRTGRVSSQQVARIRANFHRLTIGDTRTQVYVKLGVPGLNTGIGQLSSALWDLTTHRLTDAESLILSFDRFGPDVRAARRRPRRNSMYLAPFGRIQ